MRRNARNYRTGSPLYTCSSGEGLILTVRDAAERNGEGRKSGGKPRSPIDDVLLF